MTVRQYALGVVVSAGVTISGVLWYQNRMPYIAGEDITACVAAAVERKWVTDWITPAYTTTVFRKASDLILAADLMRKAITNANVIYLDAGTWADGGLDMAVSHTWSGSPYNTNTVGTAFLEAPVSTFMNGIALADKVTPYSITTNIVEVLHQNLVIVSQTPTTYPDWPSTGRTNGTIFTYQINPVWGMGEYTDGNANWQPIWFNEWASDLWSTWHEGTETIWANNSGDVIGDYFNYSYFDEGVVTIGYHNSYSPSTYTTNYVVINASTNLPLYAHGQPDDKMPDVEKIKPLIGNTNSWWAYKGFNEPYTMNQVETNGRPLYFITTNGLNQLRKLATNMVRTVQFDFPCSNRAVTAQIIGLGMWNAIHIDYSSTFDDFDALWANAVTAINSGVGLSIITNTLTTLKGTTTGYAANMHIRAEDEFGVIFTNYQHLAGLSFSNRRFEFTIPSIPVVAYTNGYISRMRVYVQYEVTGEMGLPSKDQMLRMDGGWWNLPVTYSYLKTKTDENLEDRFGWDYTFGGGTPSFDVPADESDDDAQYNVYSLATNRVWVLVADVASPTNPPSFTLGPSDLVSASYTYPQPKYGLSSTNSHGVRFKGYAASIAHSALVIDWDFKIFGDTDYVPEAYKPAWTTNNIPPWSTNSP
jgi:hypothetical protein